MIRSELKTSCFICEVCQKEGGQGPRVFIRVEKIKIASLVPNIYGVSLDVILEVHQKKTKPDVNKRFRLRESLFVFSPTQISLHSVLGNGLEAHHEKGLLDVIKSQHFFLM